MLTQIIVLKNIRFNFFMNYIIITFKLGQFDIIGTFDNYNVYSGENV